MEKDLNSTSITPPRIIPSFVAGFNAIANHIYLILFPVLLDVFLWFGPLVRIKNLVQPVFENALQQMAGAYPADTVAMLQTSKDAIIQFFEHFNLFFLLRTYPVGVPSLLVGIAPLTNPLGNISIKELVTNSQVELVVIARNGFTADAIENVKNSPFKFRLWHEKEKGIAEEVNKRE
jgi:hypothetical protein